MTLLALLAVCVLPLPTEPVRDHVDLIEINHFYEYEGKARHVFDQLIFWNWNGFEARHDVVAWRLLKRPEQLPRYDHEAGIYRAVWMDGEVFRHVTAMAVVERWSQYDPELLAREDLPKEKRRELTHTRPDKPSVRPLEPAP